MAGCRSLRKRKAVSEKSDEVMLGVKKQKLGNTKKIRMVEDKENTGVKKQKLGNTKKRGIVEDRENTGVKKLNSKILTSKAKVTTKENIGGKKLNSEILTSKAKVTTNILQERVFSQNGRKNVKTDEKNINPVQKVPIWKRNLNVTKSERSKKRIKKCDVYDISLDEELMSSEVITKKKVVKHLKSNMKSNVIKNKSVPISVKKKIKHKSISSTINIDKPLQINETVQQIFPAKKISVTSCDIISLQVENKRQDSVSNGFMGNDDIEVISEDCTALDVPFSESKPQDNHTFLSQFADEFERSFLAPKMTSTPSENVHAEKCSTLKQKVADVSYIPCVNKENSNTVITVNNSPTKDMLSEDKDITLFESPTKKEKVLKQTVIKFKSPKKSIQINLFDDDINSPSSPNNLEESILQPKKAYHTPDNFKTHLVKAKRSAAVQKKEIKKSKQDIMIEKLAQHFEEIGDTHLCVE